MLSVAAGGESAFHPIGAGVIVPAIFRLLSAPVGQVFTHWPQKVQGLSMSRLLNLLKMVESCPRPATVMADACSQSLQIFVQRKHEIHRS